MARKKKSAGISKEYLNKCKNANNYNDVLALIAPKYREEKVKLMEQYEVIWDKMLSIVEREHNKPFTPDLDY